MNTSKLTHYPRVARSAAIGSVISLALAVVGHRLDTAVPAIPLDHQVLYNWAVLLLSPVSFLARLTNPDGAIVASLSFALVAAAFNGLCYAFVSWSLAAIRRTFATAVASTSFAVTPDHSVVLSSAPSASRRASPSECLAERYEHRLTTGHSEEEEDAPVLSGTGR